MGTVMVTGGRGFVGRYLVDLLVRSGERVISYNRDYAESEDDAVAVVQGELFDIPRLIRTLQAFEVDRVLHTAAMSHPELSLDLPITTVAANINGTLSVLEAVRFAKVARVVNFSSECAYGDQEAGPVREDARMRPSTPYGVTKVATEMLAGVYTRRYDVDVVSLRITEVYGPGNPMPSILPEMLRAAIQGTPFHLANGGDHRFQFVHAEDVARAAYAAVTATGLTQPVYNISGGRQMTARETADIIREQFPQAELFVGPGHIDTLDQQAPWDLSAAAAELGYRPQWALEDGIRNYADWLSTHPY